MSDLDQDGCQELIIGDDFSFSAGSAAGAVYVHSGRTGAALYAFYGESWSSLFGDSVDSAGDVNADGTEDILVGSAGAHLYGTTVTGAAYVYSGKDGQLLHRILSSATSGYSRLGESVSSLGDINFDGHDDFLVGEPERARPGGRGIAWVFSGRDGSVLLEVGNPGDYGVGTVLRGITDLTGDGIPDFLTTIGGGVGVFSGADGSEVRRHVNTQPFASFGEAMADLGDLDQDGIADYAIGAPAPSIGSRGSVFVFSGASGAEIFYFAGGPDDEFGSAVAGAGDVDGDGYPEILVGAQGERRGDGVAYLFSGFDGRSMASFSSHSVNASYIGESVTGLGDVDGDGLADLAIGSNWLSGGTSQGAVRVYSLRSYLNLSPLAISASAGGIVTFEVDFADSEAGQHYGLFASIGAGRMKVDGMWLPLRRTPVLEQMVLAPPAAFPGARGTLDTAGDATATLTLAPNQASRFVGRTIKFVAVSFETGSVSRFSAAMPLEIGP